MAALTADRDTPRRAVTTFTDPVAAGAVIHAGALVMLDADGYAVPAATATGLTPRGRAAEAVTGGGADGDVTVRVERGCFRWANSSGADEITRAHIGAAAYAVDDQTVAATDGTGTRSACGTIRDVDAQGVWVEV
ncbi:hypothetical protein [Roseospira goensis]|uniref:Uncharacterized protein n=1 Tax=Roseospira goensis TaxID=391922 RepID=A0A7W6WMS4_9PROT|nr:hypothetical protein [Roseospira goensis]MBB4287792.1 hypothetical protein [Roseospira goensis]